MKRQIVSVILCMALMVSLLSVVSFTAAAENTVTAITASSNADKAIAAADNILAAATCSDSTLAPTVVPDVYNGVVDDNKWNRKEPYIQGAVGDYMWITYTLAAETAVEAVLVAGSGNERNGLGLGFTGFAVYVGDKDAAAIQADSSVAPAYESAEQIRHGVRVDFATPIKGTKIVFRLGIHRDANWNGNVWISELAAKGNAPFSVTNITASSNADKTIAAEDNILTGASCSESTLASTTVPDVYNGVVDDNKWNRKEPYIQGAVGDYMWITYTLPAETDVEAVLVAGSGASRNGLGLGFTGFAVYIGDKDAAAIQADSSIAPVYETDTQVCHGVRVDFAAPIKGTKIVFRLGIHRDANWNGNVWISEMGATGYVPFSVTNITASSNTDKAIATEDNLLKDAACSDSTMAFTACDGLYNGVVDDNKWYGQEPYMTERTANHKWVTYTLTEETDVKSILVAGSGTSRNGLGLGFTGFAVYIGDMDATAIQADNTVKPAYETDAQICNGVRVDFTEPIKGTKIVFKLGIHRDDAWNGRIWMSEIAAKAADVTPDGPPAEDDDDEPTEPVISSTIDVSSFQNTSKVIASADNLLIGATCSDTTINYTAKPGVYNGVVDDNQWNRKEPYIEGAVGNYMWITYTLSKEEQLGSFLVAGSGVERNGLGLGFTGFAIYVGNKDAAAIRASKNAQPVYETDAQIRYGMRVDLKEPASGTKVVFRLGIHRDANWNGNVWISELAAAAYDPDAYQAPTEALIAGKVADIAYMSWPRTAGVKMEKSMLDTSLIANATDGDMTTLYNPRFVGDATKYVEGYAPMYSEKGGGILDPNYGWITMIYYLGGEAEIQSMNLLSGNEPGYYIAGADMYLGDSIETLFNEENLVYTSNGGATITDEFENIHLDPAADKIVPVHSADLSGQHKTGRYVAFTITRPYGSAVRGWFIPRLAELEVNGWMRNPEEPFDTTKQTLTDADTGIRVTLSRLNLDDVDFFNGLTLKITTADLPATVEKNIENQWLTVDSKVMTFTLLDKNGNPISNDVMGNRYWKMEIPTTAGYLQTLAFLKNGQLEHFRNSRTNAAGDAIIAGNEWGNEATLYGNGHQIVILKYNSLETINQLKGETVKGIQVYSTDGVFATVADLSLLWLAVLPVVGAAAVLFVRRRRRQS